MRNSTVVGRETTDGPLLSRVKLERFGTRETADVEAGEMDLGDGGDGPDTGSGVVGLTVGCRAEEEGDLSGLGDSSGTSLSLSDVSELSP